MVKVSFDFDGTLQTEEVQKYACELIGRGIEVWVVTTRWDENHKHKYSGLGKFTDPLRDFWLVADDLGIPRWKVRFTNMEWKWTYLSGTHFVWHLDDNDDELAFATLHKCNVPIVLVKEGWKEECEKLLKKVK